MCDDMTHDVEEDGAIHRQRSPPCAGRKKGENECRIAIDELAGRSKSGLRSGDRQVCYMYSTVTHTPGDSP
jgi:hypothetical protein